MVKSIKKVHAQPKASGTIYQSSFYKAFTENWFLSAFNTVMLSVFDWFSLSAFNALKALLTCGVKQIKALRRVEVVAALLLMFPLVRQLFLAYLGFQYQWSPSLGRWFVIRTIGLYAEAYWTFYARHAVVMLAVGVLARYYASAAYAHLCGSVVAACSAIRGIVVGRISVKNADNRNRDDMFIENANRIGERSVLHRLKRLAFNSTENTSCNHSTLGGRFHAIAA